MDFYPRSPCGERRPYHPDRPRQSGISIHALLAESDPFGRGAPAVFCIISIHALLAESDGFLTHMLLESGQFLSTLSLRRATVLRMCPAIRLRQISIHALLAESDYWILKNCGGMSISIHALLAESDREIPLTASIWYHFYPRSPCGERH